VAAQACERAGRLEALLLAVQRLVAMPEIGASTGLCERS